MPENKNSQSQEHSENDQNQQFNNNNSGNKATGTQRQPYDNDTGDPSTGEPHAADEDITIGQKDQPGLPHHDEKSWSPGSDAAVP